MSGLYPSVNDNEFNLLKKIASNTGGIADSGGGGGGGGVTSISAGTGVSVNQSTGSVTVSLDQTQVLVGKNLQLSHSVLTYAASCAVDFSIEGFRTLTLAGNITFTSSNLASVRSATIRIICDGTQRNFTFPAGWTFPQSTGVPANCAANKTAVLALSSFGTTDADVIATYSVQG